HLLTKIRDRLLQRILTEANLVYLLVELRKLMERDGYKDTSIKSFCNWIVHTELTQAGGGTTDLLAEFDEAVRIVIEENRGWPFPQHYSFRRFRQNLKMLFSNYKLP